ncbi:unannotated protein [freshwater metagenome]|uniref:Unannotated protein n=1 Tax=freshwater metagenome TaxID=449393 RepID=A0A6J6XGS0_9ZZZZ
MDAGFFDVLHDATDEYLTSVVANCVDIDLGGILEEAVDEHGPLRREPALLAEAAEAGQFGHCPSEMVTVVHDLHTATPKHIARTNENGEANRVDNLQRLLEVECSATRRLRNVEALTQRRPLLTVFGKVDRGRRRARNDAGRQLARQLQRSLSAERHDDLGCDSPTCCSLGRNHVEHIFFGERLEVETIAGVVVGTDRLGVAVDHHGLKARFAQAERSMYAAVVELDALPNAVRPRAQDDDLGLRGWSHFIFVFVGAVVIRGLRSELGGARIDGLVRGHNTSGFTSGTNVCFRFVPEIRQLRIAEPKPLCATPFGTGKRCGRAALVQHRALFDDDAHLIEEPRVDAAGVVNGFDRERAT